MEWTVIEFTATEILAYICNLHHKLKFKIKWLKTVTNQLWHWFVIFQSVSAMCFASLHSVSRAWPHCEDILLSPTILAGSLCHGPLDRDLEEGKKTLWGAQLLDQGHPWGCGCTVTLRLVPKASKQNKDGLWGWHRCTEASGAAWARPPQVPSCPSAHAGICLPSLAFELGNGCDWKAFKLEA